MRLSKICRLRSEDENGPAFMDFYARFSEEGGMSYWLAEPDGSIWQVIRKPDVTLGMLELGEVTA